MSIQKHRQKYSASEEVNNLRSLKHEITRICKTLLNNKQTVNYHFNDTPSDV